MHHQYVSKQSLKFPEDNLQKTVHSVKAYVQNNRETYPVLPGNPDFLICATMLKMEIFYSPAIQKNLYPELNQAPRQFASRLYLPVLYSHDQNPEFFQH